MRRTASFIDAFSSIRGLHFRGREQRLCVFLPGAPVNAALVSCPQSVSRSQACELSLCELNECFLPRYGLVWWKLGHGRGVGASGGEESGVAEGVAMAIVASSPVGSYEDVRKQRMAENNKKMEALGLLSLSKSLLPEKKNTPVKRLQNSRKIPTEGEYAMEARRSTRLGGKPAVSYRDQLDLLPGMRQRVVRDRQPLARRYLSDAARMAAIDEAEEVFKDIKNPGFVKPMMHSHIASGFWLGLPSIFSKDYLPRRDEKFVLEDEKTLEWECQYLAHKVGLSGGWRGFSLDHELVEGDCLIFELVEPRRFKVYIFRCEEEFEGQVDVNDDGGDVDKEPTTEKKKTMKYNKKAPASAPPELAKGRKLGTTTKKLDLEEGKDSGKEGNDESPKGSKKVKKEDDKDVSGPSRLSKRKRAKEEDDDNEAVLALQSFKKEVKFRKQNDKDCVVDLGSDGEEDADFLRAFPKSKDTQQGIRPYGRITRNSLAKSSPKKSE